MSEMNLPDWYANNPNALSSDAQKGLARARLAREYEDKFLLATQPEVAAFRLATMALVCHGQPAYFWRTHERNYVHDPLTTGFRAIGEPVYVPHAGNNMGIVVPAIRLGLGDNFSRNINRLPYKEIRWAQVGKADVSEVAERLASLIPGVELRGYLLATHQADIKNDVWSGLVREAPVRSRWQGATARYWNKNPIHSDRYIRHAVRSYPELAMWSVPLPEMDQLQRYSGKMPLLKQLRPNLAPYRDPARFDEVAAAELTEASAQQPQYQRAMEWMHAAEVVDTPVRNLGALVLQPTPAS